MTTPAVREFPVADPTAPLDEIHHVAIAVRNVAEAVDWYRKHFRCEIGYQDATWALLEFGNTRLALALAGGTLPATTLINRWCGAA